MIRKYVKKYDGPFERKESKRRKRRKKDKQPKRESPSQRQGTRYKTVAVREDTYVRLHELGRFYKKSLARIVAEAIEPAFQKAYEESLTLARIEANREKERQRVEALKRQSEEDETFDDDKPPRRTHF